jgi:hypothetical protein
MESLMEAIEQLRSKNENYLKLGDWSSFLNQLIRSNDGKSIKRLREIVQKECKRHLINFESTHSI